MRKVMKIFTSLSVLTVSALMVACAPQEDLAPDFGNAVQHNMSVHIINPAPSYSSTQQVPDFDGPRATGAQQRYDEGEIIPPERLRTSGTGGGS